MSDSSLYNSINAAAGDLDNNQKLIGYTVSSYQGISHGLQQIGVTKSSGDAQTSNSMDLLSRTISTRRYTVLDELDKLTGVDDGNGFIEGQYQGLCIFKDFMSFVVQVIDSENKKQTAYVGVNKGELNHVNSGIGCVSGNPVFPAVKHENASYYKGLETENSTFKIGIGLDIENFGLKFFKKFFPKIEWSTDMLSKIAANEALFAEVIFPKNGSAKALHAMVIADIKDCQGAPFQIHIPNPLLLLNDYSSIGSVVVSFNGNSEKVGGDKVTNPFAGSRYYHKNASIADFTPYNIDYFIKSNTSSNVVNYSGTTLCSGNLETKGRVRLYCDKDKKDQVISIVGGTIPDDYQETLFQSSNASEDFILSEIETSGLMVFSGDVYFPPELQEIISKEHYMKALSIIRTAEVGTPTLKGAGNAEWNVAGDGAGITFGNYQTTGKSGGLNRLIDLYVNDSKSSPSHVAEINLYKSAAGVYSKKTKDVENLMIALSKAGNEDPNMGLIQSKHLYEEQIKRKGFISAYKRGGLSSALGFTIALHCYNQGKPKNLWDGVSAATSEADKCNLLLAHEDSFLRKFTWWKVGGNHDRYISDYKKAVRNSNFDLSQKQRWCNATF